MNCIGRLTRLNIIKFGDDKLLSYLYGGAIVTTIASIGGSLVLIFY